MPRSLRVLAAFALLTFCADASLAQQPAPAAFRPGPGQGAYLVLTDVHFDPLADRALMPRLAAAPVEGWREILESGSPNLPPFGRDTNYALLRSTLEAAAETGTRYDFVLMPGDFLAHGFQPRYAAATGGTEGYASFVEKTMVFVVRLVQERFPGIPVVASFGNNDSTCGDYAISPQSGLFARLAEEWSVLRSNDEAAADFRAGGSFALPHPTVPKQRLVVLNDIYWSAKYRDCDAASPDAAAPTLAWLEWQLYRASRAGERVTLMFHIPPGIDSYSSAHGHGSCAKATPFWAEADLDQFVDLVDRYAGVLAPAIAGHTHMDEFRVLSSAADAPLLPFKIFPAVSPIFGNAPAFTVVAYDRGDGSLRDYAVWGLRDLVGPEMPAVPGSAAAWRPEYTFGATYGAAAFDAASAAALAMRVRGDERVRETFARLYAGLGGGSKPITAENWRAFSCAQTEFQSAGYAACRCGGAN